MVDEPGLPPHNPSRADLRDYLGLIRYRVYADLRAESLRTYAGFFWWIIDPIASMAVYYVVFELVLRRGTPNYVAFLFVGLVPWRWLSTTIMHGSQSIYSARSLMQQVYLPKAVLSVVSFLTDTVKFLVVFVVLIGFVLVSGFPLTSAYLALPYVLLVQGVLVAGLTLLLAAVTPFVPDLRMILENFVRLWLFLSGVFYAVSELSEAKQALFRINPMTVVIESYRDVLMEGRWPRVGHLSAILVLSAVLVVVGLGLIRRWDFDYPKLSK